MRARPTKKWVANRLDPSRIGQLCVEAGVAPLTAHALLNRGLDNAAAVHDFMNPSYSHLLDPMLLPDMRQAVERIRKAVQKNEKIVIYGDYDADGVTATAALMETIQLLGGDVEFYTPYRHEDGYGLYTKAIQEIHSNGGDLLITVDCGVTAKEPIGEAHRLGLDVIVTDHHKIDPERLPDREAAVALIDPHLEGHGYSFTELSGVGLAFKLAQATLGGSPESSDFLRGLLDLVAIGTIADVANLTGENRALAKLGLEVLSERKRPGLKALCESAGIKEDAPVTGEDVGFRLGPRLNAAGRLDLAQSAALLLLTDNPMEARKLAAALEEKNQERRSEQDKVIKEAEALIRKEADLERDAAILAAKKGWNSGVVGIAAGRLAERYNRPTILIAMDEGAGRGSGRSIPGFHLQEALLECREHMEIFGGHAAAAGMTVKAEKVEPLREAFLNIAKQRLSEEDLRPKLRLDAVVPLSELTESAVEELEALDPFGDGNPPIAVGLRGLSVVKNSVVAMGADKSHLSVRLTDGRRSIRAVYWGGATYADRLNTPKAEVDAAGAAFLNRYKGRKSVELKISDMKVSTPVAGVGPPVWPPAGAASWLRVEDRRGENKKQYLCGLLADSPGPTLIYVQDDDKLEQAQKILQPNEGAAFCSRWTPEEERRRALKKLMAGELSAVVSSFALTNHREPGEWIGLRRVVFCHPPADMEMFLKQTDPLQHGRTGSPPKEESRLAVLLYNEDDIERALEQCYLERPDRSALIAIYQTLGKQKEPILESDWLELVDERLRAGFPHARSVFEELELVEQIGASNGGRYRVKGGAKRKLESSPTYRRDQAERIAFEVMSRYWAKASRRDFYEALRRRHKEEFANET